MVLLSWHLQTDSWDDCPAIGWGCRIILFWFGESFLDLEEKEQSNRVPRKLLTLPGLSCSWVSVFCQWYLSFLTVGDGAGAISGSGSSSWPCPRLAALLGHCCVPPPRACYVFGKLCIRGEQSLLLLFPRRVERDHGLVAGVLHIHTLELWAGK